MRQLVNDLSDALRSAPRNCWLALNSDQSQIVGHGETMEQATSAAQQNGVSEPVLIWSPDKWLAHAY